jgi:hypothetical protein
MRNNMIKEQKVFALIKEILSKRNHFFIHCTVIHCTYWLTYMFKPYDSVAAYMGFMWMLLLVAYGQRDPNAYFLTEHIWQLQPRDLRQHEPQRCVHLGKYLSAQQPLWRVPRFHHRWELQTGW